MDGAIRADGYSEAPVSAMLLAMTLLGAADVVAPLTQVSFP
jgi:hypothetical protein